MTILQQHYTVPDILTLSFLACSIVACTLVCIHYLVKVYSLPLSLQIPPSPSPIFLMYYSHAYTHSSLLLCHVTVLCNEIPFLSLCTILTFFHSHTFTSYTIFKLHDSPLNATYYLSSFSLSYPHFLFYIPSFLYAPQITNMPITRHPIQIAPRIRDINWTVHITHIHPRIPSRTHHTHARTHGHSCTSMHVHSCTHAPLPRYATAYAGGGYTLTQTQDSAPANVQTQHASIHTSHAT